MDKNLSLWLTVSWVQENFNQLGLTVFYSLFFMTILAFLKNKIQQWKEGTERTPALSEEDSRIICKLTRFESSVDHLHKFGGSIVAFALILKSQQCISPNLVKNALIFLTKKNEILRTKISRTKLRINGKRRVEKEWKFMENEDFAEFHLKLKAMTSDQWLTVFERELTKQFPEEGPLWRFVMLKEQFDPQEGMYDHAFVLSAHHLICDSYSGFAFFKDFLEFVNGKLCNESHQQEHTNVLNSSLPQLLKSHIHMPQIMILYSLFMMFINRLVERLRPMPIRKNLYMSIYPPKIASNPDATKKTCFIPRSFCRDNTKNLIRMCKANQCTVHGAFFAIATISMATILQRGGCEVPFNVTSSVSVDVRKNCSPAKTPQELGCFSLDCNIEMPFECKKLPQSTSSSQFWEFAQKCDLALQSAIQNGEHIAKLKLIETLQVSTAKIRGKLAKDTSTGGRSNSLFHITNIGKRNAMESSTSLKVEGFYFALAEHNVGPVFSNNIVTVNGALYWGFTYFSHVISEAQAMEYVNLVLGMLEGV